MEINVWDAFAQHVEARRKILDRIHAIRRAHLGDRIGTHWDGCELTHARCAIATLCDELERLITGEHRQDVKIHDVNG